MKIAVCGSAPSSVQLAPVQDASFNEYLGGRPAPQYPPSQFINETWQIWGCSPGAYGMLARADRWFELHRYEPGKAWFSPEYVQFLQQFRGPVYTGGPVEGLLNGIEYPIARVEAEFGSYFLTSSLALMAALAILEIEDARRARASGPQCVGEAFPGQITPGGNVAPEKDVIGFFGVDMAAHEEWAMQRPGCQFFVMEALRRGIGILVPPESDLLRPEPVYGLSEWDHSYIKATARMRELNGRKEAAQQQLAQATQSMQFLAGAVDNMNYMVKTWFSPYGIPAGRVITLDPSNPGLGGGITLPRPFDVPPEVVERLVDDVLPAAAPDTTFVSLADMKTPVLTLTSTGLSKKAKRRAKKR